MNIKINQLGTRSLTEKVFGKYMATMLLTG